MQQRFFLFIIFVLPTVFATAQITYSKDKIYSPYVLDDAKAAARKERILQDANSLKNLPINNDEDTCEPIENALWNIAQYFIHTPQSDSGVDRLVKNYYHLTPGAQRTLLEVLYGMYPMQYSTEIAGIMERSTQPKSFAIAALYLFRADPTTANAQYINKLAAKLTCSESQWLMVTTLLQYIAAYNTSTLVPNTDSLFARQQMHGYKMIYSFQRKNRDYPGLAIVQNADGSFVKDSTGHLRSFTQLARSASGLPYFISNGNTPQGLYSISGTGISRNVFLGPTPNLQMVMLPEVGAPVFAHFTVPIQNATPEQLYRCYFASNWQSWPGIMEAYNAGKIGRSEIIAHGTTLDPEWFKGLPFYPLTPSMGCLSAQEIWDKKTGRPTDSQQLGLVNAYMGTKGSNGFLIVIDLDDKQEAVNAGEIEKLVKQYWENRLKNEL